MPGVSPPPPRQSGADQGMLSPQPIMGGKRFRSHVLPMPPPGVASIQAAPGVLSPVQYRVGASYYTAALNVEPKLIRLPIRDSFPTVKQGVRAPFTVRAQVLPAGGKSRVIALPAKSVVVQQAAAIARAPLVRLGRVAAPLGRAVLLRLPLRDGYAPIARGRLAILISRAASVLPQRARNAVLWMVKGYLPHSNVEGQAGPGVSGAPARSVKGSPAERVRGSGTRR